MSERSEPRSERSELQKTLREHLEQSDFDQTTRGEKSHLSPNSEVEHLGRYRISGSLGQGGMGEVLAVEDEDLEREVAAKVLLGQSDSAQLERFVQEARLTGQLQHPNIVPVHELGMAPGDRIYFTMKRIEGEDLRERLRRRAQTPESAEAQRSSLIELLQVFLKVCDAIQFAHSLDVIHRDLKPANIMVGRFGEVQVMDWGVAKKLGQADPAAGRVTPEASASQGPETPLKTLDGTVMGTPAYMSPEQARGEIGKLDQRSDIYSLGAILYEMLTLQPPYLADRVPQILSQVLRGDLTPPSQRAPGRLIPWELEAVVEKAMSRSSADRYPSVEALHTDLTHYLEGRTLAAADYSPLQNMLKWARRHRAAVTATLAVLLIGVVVTVVAFVKINRAYDQESLARQREHGERSKAETALQGLNRAHRAETQARRELEVSLANALLYKARVAVREKRSLDAAAYVVGAQAMADTWSTRLAGYNLPVPLATPHRTLALESATQVLYSPDGRMLATFGENAVGVWNVADWKPLLQFKGLQDSATCVFSADSRLLAIGGKGKLVRVWDLRRKKLIHRLSGHEGSVDAIAFSPDSKLLATASHDRDGRRRVDTTVRLWNVTDGQLATRLPGLSRDLTALGFTPDGRLATGDKRGLITLWDIRSGKALRQFTGLHTMVSSILFPDSARMIAAGWRDPEVLEWDLATGKQVGSYQSPLQQGARTLSLGKSGRVLATAGGGSIRIWRRATGQLLQKLHGLSASFSPQAESLAVCTRGRIWFYRFHTGSIERIRRLAIAPASLVSLAFSPDGQHIATGGGSVMRLWNVRSGRLERTFWGAWGNIAFSPDGERLASGHSSPSLWDVRSGRRLHRLSGMPASVLSIAFSRDGKRLATGHLDGQVAIWTTDTGKLLRTLSSQRGPVKALLFTLDDRRLVTAGPALRSHTLEGGNKSRTYDGHTQMVLGLALSPGGRLLASVAADGVARIWDLQKNRPVRHFDHGGTYVVSAAFDPRGDWLLTGTAAGQVHVWDVRKGFLRSFDRHTGWVSAIAFTPDGSLFATGAGDSTFRVWGLDRAANQQAGTGLTGLEVVRTRIQPAPLDHFARLHKRPDAKHPAWPENPIRLRLVAERAAKSKDHQKALAVLSAALKLDPRAVTCLLLRAQILASQRKFGAAEAEVARAIHIAPGYAMPYYVRGLLRQHLGDRSGALDALRRAAKLAPSPALARKIRARIATIEKK